MFRKVCRIAIDEAGLITLVDLLNANRIGRGVTITKKPEEAIRVVEFKSDRKAYDRVVEELKRTVYKFGIACMDAFQREVWVEQ